MVASPVIPLTFTKDEDMEFIKHRRSEVNNGVTEEIQEQVPKLTDSATPYHILRFFSSFTQVRRHMQWTTGPRLFQRFHMHLEGTHLTTWEDQINGLAETVANFDAQFIAFKGTLLQGYKYLDQMDYLRTVKKTKDQTPKDYLRLVRASETLASQLPDAPNNPGFTDLERRRNFLRAMPLDWQTKFIEANLRVEDETINDMRLYFERLQELYPYEENKKEEGSNRNGGQSNNRGRRNSSFNQGNRGSSNQGGRSNRRSSRDANSGNNRSNTNRNTSRIQNSDPCPLPGHGNHTWGECRSNRYNNEYQRNNSGNNTGQGNRNQGQREVNATERQGSTQGRSQPSQARGNGQDRQAQGEQLYFQTDESVTNDPESFFYKDGVQEELEIDDSEEPTQWYDSTALTEQQRMQMVPSTIAMAKQVNDVKTKAIYKSLLDPGGSNVIIKRSALPKDVELFPVASQHFNTAAGGMNVTATVILHDVILPEFSYSRRIKTVKAFVFDNDSIPYDVIFGRDFLNGCRIDVCGSDLTCKWYGNVIPFHPPNFFQDNERLRPILTIPPARVQEWESNATIVTASVNTTASVEEVVKNQTHLSEEQRMQLLQVLKKYTTLFSGELGRYKRRKFHIDLKDDAVPYHCKGPYPVAAANMSVLKEELQKQCNEDILERVGESEWGMPMMVIPKKNGSIRTIDDLRELNKQVKRKVYPLPKIQDIFHRRKGYKYASKLDLTNCYYTYELDEESSWLCVLVTPFGKYRRKRLPQGMKQSPDWAQAAIEEPLLEADLLHECVEAYIDDIGAFSNSFEEHLQHLDKTLAVLQVNGYTVNPTKCSWCVQEMEWLGHWMTPTGLKPIRNKIKGVVQLAPPQTVKQLRSFLGMVNYYRDFWKRRSHILAPLTAMTKLRSKQKLPWTTECDKAFKQIKALLIEEVLLFYPDPNKTFYIEPDASKLQLGATIYQLGDQEQRQPVAFFSRKLTPAQTRYPASDLEALCITEVFEEYRTILYGADIVVRTDHKNLTQRDLKSQRLLHWRLLLEEFNPTFEYLPGHRNTVADALSRLPMQPIAEEEAGTQLTESLLYYPTNVDQFPLDFANIAQEQQNDAELLPLADQDEFDLHEFNGTELICKQVQAQWKIVLPESLIEPTIAWYHIILGHCGITRMEVTLSNHLWFPHMRQRIIDHVSQCEHCKRYKFNGPGQGHMPPRNDTSVPWQEVAVDTIGPWKVPLMNNQALIVHALTMIDPATTLSECVRVEDGTASHAAMLFTNNWLSRYPKPLRCIHDQGTEFIGMRFQHMLHLEGIQSVPTTVRNPQANAICERMHKTVEDTLNTLLRHEVPEDVATANELIDSLIAAAQRAIRSAVHTTLRVSPGALVFHRDMMLPIPLMVDFNLLRERRQAMIDYNNSRENRRRLFKDYSIGDNVLIIKTAKGKLKPKTEGPYQVVSVHVNGTITIQRGPGVTERLSIRRVKPF
jgi:hypothetical protein